MEFNSHFFNPFGPPILEADCPEFIVDALNEYHDTYHTRPNAKKDFPNLLTRSISNIFIETDFADDIGLLDYMEYLAGEYVKKFAENNSKWVKSDTYENILERYGNIRVTELDGNEEGFIDGWINVYGEDDFTPIHTHGGELSAVMLLKVPDDPKGLNEITNDADEISPNGKLNYHYAPDSHDFVNDMYAPDQYKGKTLLFPHNLRHVYYPHKLKGQERRTLSLNFSITFNN